MEPKDRNGMEVHLGDKVTIEGKIVALSGNGACIMELDYPVDQILNTRQVARIVE